jgi:hypothetical protein
MQLFLSMFLTLSFSVCFQFTQAAFLSMLCYNFGVDSFQKHIYEQSVNWLRESFEIGKTKNAVGNKNQVLACTHTDTHAHEINAHAAQLLNKLLID